MVLPPVCPGVLPSILPSFQQPVLRGILARVLLRLLPGILSSVLPHVHRRFTIVLAGLPQVLPDVAAVPGPLPKILQAFAPVGARQRAIMPRLLHVARKRVLPGVAQLTRGQPEVLPGVAVQALVLQAVLMRVVPKHIGLPPVLPLVQSSLLARILPGNGQRLAPTVGSGCRRPHAVARYETVARKPLHGLPSVCKRSDAHHQ
jgi:hypothetical protein